MTQGQVKTERGNRKLVGIADTQSRQGSIHPGEVQKCGIDIQAKDLGGVRPDKLSEQRPRATADFKDSVGILKASLVEQVLSQ